MTKWQPVEKGIVTGCTISLILFVMGMNLEFLELEVIVMFIKVAGLCFTLRLTIHQYYMVNDCHQHHIFTTLTVNIHLSWFSVSKLWSCGYSAHYKNLQVWASVIHNNNKKQTLSSRLKTKQQSIYWSLQLSLMVTSGFYVSVHLERIEDALSWLVWSAKKATQMKWLDKFTQLAF